MDTNDTELTMVIESLPVPNRKGTLSLEETLLKRHSVRNFSAQVLSKEQIGQILWAAQGINRPDRQLRTCPSARAIYPLKTYIIVPDGIYTYIPRDHALEIVRRGDYRQDLAEAAMRQASVAKAPLSIVFCANFGTIVKMYGDRGVLYTYVEAGHAAQCVHLQAVAMELSSVSVGAFIPEQVKEVLLCDNEEPLYIIPVGYEAK
jgi:SagB-type dehydrogenase family enzyme